MVPAEAGGDSAVRSFGNRDQVKHEGDGGVAPDRIPGSKLERGGRLSCLNERRVRHFQAADLGETIGDGQPQRAIASDPRHEYRTRFIRARHQHMRANRECHASMAGDGLGIQRHRLHPPIFHTRHRGEGDGRFSFSAGAERKAKIASLLPCPLKPTRSVSDRHTRRPRGTPNEYGGGALRAFERVDADATLDLAELGLRGRDRHLPPAAAGSHGCSCIQREVDEHALRRADHDVALERVQAQQTVERAAPDRLGELRLHQQRTLRVADELVVAVAAVGRAIHGVMVPEQPLGHGPENAFRR